MTTNQTAPVTDEELDQMIWKLERDGMTPKQLSLMRELREVRRAKGEPVAWMYDGEDGREYNGHNEFSGGGKGVPLYAAPSAQVVPDELTREEYKRRFMADDCFDDTFRGGWNACRAAKLQAGNPRVTPDEQSFWNWLRDKMPTTYRWSRELEDTPENSALVTKGKASALDMLSAWKGCSAAMQSDGTLTNEDTMQSPGNSEQLEPVSNRDELNSPATPDGWMMVPVEPTPEMQSAAAGAIRFDTTAINKLWTGNAVYRAMIAAAPKEVG